MNEKRRYNKHTEFLYTRRTIDLHIWADCKASGALVYSYLSAWINYNQKDPRCRHDGSIWVFKTIDEIYDGLGRLLSKRTISTALKELEKHDYIQVGDYNKVRCNRTKYYALARRPGVPRDYSPASLAIINLKKSMDATNKQLVEERRCEKVDDYVSHLMDQDYSDTPADEKHYDGFGREFCFADILENDADLAYEIMTNYVKETLRKRDVPNFNNFVSNGMQELLANRYAGQCIVPKKINW